MWGWLGLPAVVGMQVLRPKGRCKQVVVAARCKQVLVAARVERQVVSVDDERMIGFANYNVQTMPVAMSLPVALP